MQRIATDSFGGWGPQVRDGAFWHEYSAPSAGPPPWDVSEITPTTVYAVASEEPYARPAAGCNPTFSRPHGVE